VSDVPLDPIPFDPALDLRIERVIGIPRALVWRCWTEPELLMRWFCPRPWVVSECKIDLRPGGRFFTVMRSPEGQTFPGDGCFLEVVPERRLVFTDALQPHWRPAPESMMTGVLELSNVAGGTHYRASALHATAESRQAHANMGFEKGWNAALDQLIEVASTLM